MEKQHSTHETSESTPPATTNLHQQQQQADDHRSTIISVYAHGDDSLQHEKEDKDSAASGESSHAITSNSNIAPIIGEAHCDSSSSSNTPAFGEHNEPAVGEHHISTSTRAIGEHNEPAIVESDVLSNNNNTSTRATVESSAEPPMGSPMVQVTRAHQMSSRIEDYFDSSDDEQELDYAEIQMRVDADADANANTGVVAAAAAARTPAAPVGVLQSVQSVLEGLIGMGIWKSASSSSLHLHSNSHAVNPWEKILGPLPDLPNFQSFVTANPRKVHHIVVIFEVVIVVVVVIVSMCMCDILCRCMMCALQYVDVCDISYMMCVLVLLVE